MRPLSRTTAFLAAFLALALSAAGSDGPPPVLHIKTYVSPSGQYRLTVDPSRLHGQGKGRYRLTRDWKVMYECDLDFTFWEADVSDDGVAGGFAYTQGLPGYDTNNPGSGPGSFVVAILNADGTTRMVHATPRNRGGLNGPPLPAARGCFIDGDGNRLVVRVAPENLGDHKERWDVYRLADGEALASQTLTPPADAGEGLWYMAMTAHAVPETGLTAVLWSRTEWKPGGGRNGLRLGLVDAQCKEIWSHTSVDEFAKAGGRFSPWLLGPDIVQVPKGTRGTFAFSSYADQTRTLFAVGRDAAGDGWIVEAREEEPAAVKIRSWEEGRINLPEVNLEALGSVKLDVGGEAPPVLNIADFEIDDEGRIGFVSWDAAPHYEFRLVKPDGTTFAAVPLGFGPDEQRPVPTASWCGGDRWVLVQGAFGDGAQPRAFAVQTSAGSVTQIEGFAGANPAMQHGVAGGPRGFVLAGDYRSNAVQRFDGQGRVLWSANAPGMCQGVALQPNGEVGVLVGVVKHQIMVLDHDGQTARTIDLVEKLGKKPNYVSGLWSDVNGGWVLHDFQGKPPVYRLDADGNVNSKFEPHYADGRTFRIYGGVRPGPDGRLWTSDRAALLRLTDDGEVDLVIGRPPDSEALAELRAFTIDHQGLLYAVDGRNGTVHVFDQAGKPRRVLKPDPTDFPVESGIGSITVAGDGSVYYRPDSLGIGFGGPRYLKFAGDGTRVGFEAGIGNEVSETWAFRPGSMRRVVLGYERALILDEAGNVTAAIERRADRKWLDKVHHGSVAADGSFVILATPGMGLFSDVPPSITVFAADGTPVRTLDLPPDFVFARTAFNGRVACAVHGGDMVLFDSVTGAARVFRIPGAAKDAWLTAHVNTANGELWLLKPGTMQLQRFRMPAELAQ